MYVRSVAGVLAFLFEHGLIDVYEVPVPEEEVRCPMGYVLKSGGGTKGWKPYVQ